MKQWSALPLRALTEQRREFEPVRDDRSYRLLGVRWYGAGAFIRETVDSASTSAGQLQPARSGDLVYNRLFAWKQSFAVLGEEHAGCYASNEFPMFRTSVRADARFVLYSLLRDEVSQTIDSESTGATAISRNRWSEESFRNLVIPVPSLDRQRRIADFLDDQVARIDWAISLRLEQAELLSASQQRRVLATIAGENVPGDRVTCGLDWLGPIPRSWPVATVASQFEVLLGKMLNEERTAGPFLRPYLRNTNVQWDRVDVEDLKMMDFPPPERRRYAVLPGDLLICEGGQPGRAAIWDGRIREIYYQKALHRARTRGRSLPRWLYYCLFAAVARNAFGPASGQTTIAHLTGERLRAQRFPFPEPDEQSRRVIHLDEVGAAYRDTSTALAQIVALLTERKRALITAAVTGEFDVTTASTRAATAVTG